MKVLSSICIVIFCAVQSIICDDVVVTVEQGQLAGQLVDAVIGNFKYYSFKGIPYAQPPTGSLRFKAPQKLDSWDGVRNASEHGNVCPQFNPITSVYTAGSEDCLFLNVYTPDLKPETPLPVVFFIHGGAFMFGSGNTDLYGPDFLVAKKVIVVTINYRLNNLGFLSLGTKEVPGNAGLKDQLAALQWVNKNIECFGGNPNKITILGNTAGSASVTYHILSPLSKGLFQRAIAMSGTTTCDWGLSFEPVRRAFALGESLGFTGTGTDELLNHLQKAEVKDIVNASPTVISAEKTNNVLFKLEPFSPVVERDFGDNNFITEDPLITLISGNVNPVDVMFGYNSQEALLLVDLYNASYIEAYRKNIEMFTPVEILFDTPAKQYLEVADNIIKFYFGDKTVSVDNIAEFVSYASNASIAYHVHRFFSKWPKVGSTYLYKFSSPTRRNYYSAQGAKYNIMGVSHFDDVFSLFNAESLNLPLVEGSQEYKTMQQLTDAVTNFAKTGNPSPDSSLGVTWPEYDNVGKAYVDIGTDLTVGNAPDDKDVDFWKSMYELVGKKF